MDFYKISNPTTKQIFDAIINKEYVPIENMQSKAKQINVLLKEHFNTEEVYVTFDGVTNTGGIPIFFGAEDSIHEVASDNIEDFYSLTEEEQENEIDLLSCYASTYDEFFERRNYKQLN